MIAEQLIAKTQSNEELSEPLVFPTGAEILIDALCYEGVDTIFGYPGGAVLHIYDELWRARERVTHYLVRHEQGAVHMAEGYARSTGKVGCVLVTSGPGATNAVTGIANAYMDSTPIVVITGQVPRHLIGTDAFQEVDTVGITRPCVKHNYLVRDPRDLAAVVREAFHLARTGRPGPSPTVTSQSTPQAQEWPHPARAKRVSEPHSAYPETNLSAFRLPGGATGPPSM